MACGALAAHVRSLAERRGWDVALYPLPPQLFSHADQQAQWQFGQPAQRLQRIHPATGACPDVRGGDDPGRCGVVENP